MRLRDAMHAFCRTGAFACCNACILQGRVRLQAVMHAFLQGRMHLRDAVLAFCRTGAVACCNDAFLAREDASA